METNVLLALDHMPIAWTNYLAYSSRNVYRLSADFLPYLSLSSGLFPRHWKIARVQATVAATFCLRSNGTPAKKQLIARFSTWPLDDLAKAVVLEEWCFACVAVSGLPCEMIVVAAFKAKGRDSNPQTVVNTPCRSPRLTPGYLANVR